MMFLWHRLTKAGIKTILDLKKIKYFYRLLKGTFLDILLEYLLD
jgi:hypothetical protein